ncbi:MAG: UvrD-helicase domain-containing protein [Clostridia bacterium]|nr:UvrD-helicase domain-containing protein [Clostridia bacterium]
MDLNQLNDTQQKAVLHTEGPVLILAGAGSGKTRTVTYRIAYLIENGVDDDRILALTFTNKAAREMRERVDMLIGGTNRVLISTFHSFCVRVLRRNIDALGYKRSFTIYDDDDSKALVKQCIKELEMDEDDGLDLKMVKNKISSLKNDGISPLEFEEDNRGNFLYEDIAKVYDLYEQKLKANQALDFNDLARYHG